jgi:predicted nucleotidyltransferase
MSQKIQKDELLKRVKNVVQDLSPEAEIILYGSRAKGTPVADSDWDFLILLQTREDKEIVGQIKDRLYDLELETDTVITSIIRSKGEWTSSRYEVIPLRQEVESHGVPV